jgi:tetratricopeptide (TPR) repeat protein
MEKEASSFWVDIKRYEDILASEPNSFCFAQLSDLYRKTDLVDDAITVARRGIAVHPDYAGGYLALGRACYDKGLKKESREALERVVRVNPENMPAQRILSHLYLESGDAPRAAATLKTILYLDPNDTESRIMLESLERLAVGASVPKDRENHDIAQAEILAEEDDAELLELSEAELLADDESTPFEFDMESLPPSVDEPVHEASTEAVAGIVDEPEGDTGFEALDETFDNPFVEMSEEPVVESIPEPVHPGRDPLATSTLAELYISQGFLKRALKVYRDLLTEQPDNIALREKILELKASIDEDEEEGRRLVMNTVPLLEEEQPLVAFAGIEAEIAGPELQGDYDPVAVLEGWLDNLRRMR